MTEQTKKGQLGTCYWWKEPHELDQHGWEIDWCAKNCLNWQPVPAPAPSPSPEPCKHGFDEDSHYDSGAATPAPSPRREGHSALRKVKGKPGFEKFDPHAPAPATAPPSEWECPICKDAPCNHKAEPGPPATPGTPPPDLSVRGTDEERAAHQLEVLKEWRGTPGAGTQPPNEEICECCGRSVPAEDALLYAIFGDLPLCKRCASCHDKLGAALASPSAPAPAPPTPIDAEKFLASGENKTGMSRVRTVDWQTACQFASDFARFWAGAAPAGEAATK